MTLASICILLVLSVYILKGSKRVALLALIIGALFLTEFNEVRILGLNFFPTRVLEIFLLIRTLTRREWLAFKLNGIDKAVVWFYIYLTVVFLIRSKVGLMFQVGVAVDALILYFSCRALIESPDDLRWLLRSFVFLLIPFVLALIVERVKGHSPLGILGWGLSGEWTRDSKVRCFGSLRNPSLLGTISVGFIPIFIGASFRRLNRNWAALGIGLCFIIIWAANSGGPVGATAFGFLGWCFWRFRTKMRQVRWGIVGFVVLMAVVMKAPIWYLVAHVSGTTGGNGWHRAFLMDISAQNIGKWWFAGMPLADTAGWFPYILTTTNTADITNEFVLIGLTSGIGAMGLFILVLKRAFSLLGNALQAVRHHSPALVEDEYLLWGLGCMLAAHIVNWLGITYFDQTSVFWFTQLAAISSLSDWYLNMRSESVQSEYEELSSEHGSQIEATA
ncbi:MAG TPA: hypothetical protein VGO67_17690 [Verrucomicrobiae bacterium]|jgi:hypothetical protein